MARMTESRERDSLTKNPDFVPFTMCQRSKCLSENKCSVVQCLTELIEMEPVYVVK